MTPPNAGPAGERAWWHFVEDIEAKLPVAEMAAEVETVDGGHRLVVTAGTFVRDLAVLIDKLDPDGAVDDMLVTLLRGGTVRFEINSSAELSVADLSDPNVLRCPNQLVRHS